MERRGRAPPVFAQAAAANPYFFEATPGVGAEIGIIVRAESAIRDVAGLRGKKIGFGRASSAHSLLLAAQEKGGVDYGEITPVYLVPADAAAAFARGAIDAWSIWELFFAPAEQR
jgi:sulfonate transport system substrate-binding protein